MLSIIVCSISSHKLSIFKKNVEDTIGTKYEFIIIDNNIHKYSLCKAYNEGAKQAKYNFLCFAHEDIIFHTKNWGNILIQKLSEASTGIIGFAGSKYKTKTLSNWNSAIEYSRINIIETCNNKSLSLKCNPDNEEYSDVITLDGLCMLVRKDIIINVPFDEIHFNGFHLYDLDFSTSVFNLGFKNYVAQNVLVEHFSRGSYSKEWLMYSNIYHKKWEHILPLSIESKDNNNVEIIEYKTYYNMSCMLIKNKLLSKQELSIRCKKAIKLFPLKSKSLSIFIHYLFNKIQ